MTRWLTVWTFQVNDTISQQYLPSPIKYESAWCMCFMKFTVIFSCLLIILLKVIIYYISIFFTGNNHWNWNEKKKVKLFPCFHGLARRSFSKAKSNEYSQHFNKYSWRFVTNSISVSITFTKVILSLLKQIFPFVIWKQYILKRM